jgi:hypothetical protein
VSYLDFKDLQDQVISRGYGEVDRTRIKAWLNEAAEDVNRQGRWYFNETRWNISTVASTATLNLSSLSPAIQYFGSINPASTAAPQLTYVEYSNANPEQPFRSYTGLVSVPEYYTLVGDATIYLDPIPDGVYAYRIDGWKRHVQMVADGDVPALPQEHRHVLIYTTLMKQAERDKDPAMMDYWRSQVQTAMSQLKRYDQTARQTQGPLRVSMPRHYRGRFDG